MSIKKGVAVTGDALAGFAATIPPAVRKWIRGVFRDVNDKLSLRMSTIPTAHEPTLDMAFVDSLNGRAYPASVPGGWTIRLDTHFLGGMRHWRNWEIAALGRKNYLFVGDVEAGASIAGLYTLVPTCETRDINPFAYLSDVIPRVQDHPKRRLNELLPGAWARARADG